MAPIRKNPRRSRAAAGAGSSTVQAQLTDSEALSPNTGVESGSESEERDWAHLFPELVQKIGNDLLREDVAEYIRLRAVCQPWRSATDDPSKLEPRFFPRNWLLLLAPGRKLRMDDVAERFVNVRTGASLRIRLPKPKDYTHQGSAEGLLVLTDSDTDTICLFNPLTMVFTELPSMVALNSALNSMEFQPWYIKAAGVLVDADENGRARSSESPTVVVSLTLHRHTVLVCAKPNDITWHVVDTSCTDDMEGKLPTIKGGLSVRGHFYIPTRAGDVLTVVLLPQPHLAFVARQAGSLVCSGLSESSYIVPSDNDSSFGDMLLVRRHRGIQPTYLTCIVNLENRSLVTVPSPSGFTIILPSVTLRSSAFPSVLQDRVCSKKYLKRLLHGRLH